MLSSEPKFPIRVSPNGRYIVDRSGSPLFWIGTTHWEIFRGYSLEEARTNIELSKSAGFVFIQTKLLGQGDGTLANIHGESPFVENDVTKQNENFFRNNDSVVDIAAEMNIAVSLSIYHQSYRGIFPIEKARPWAEWIANRYRERPHVFWSITPEANQANVPIIRELAQGIRKADGGRHLITFKPDPAPFSSSFMHQEDWLDFNSMQTWKFVEQIYPMISHDYALEPSKPVVMAEGAYEAGSEYEFEVTPAWVRRQAYYSYFAGAHHAYGHNDSWRILPSWKESLSAPGALQMGILRKIFTDRSEWWLLAPDQSLLESGGQTGGRMLTLSARHESGKWIMVYLSEPHDVRVRVDGMNAAGDRVDAFWIDPRNGASVPIPGVTAAGSHDFLPPGEWEDALLVIEKR